MAAVDFHFELLEVCRGRSRVSTTGSDAVGTSTGSREVETCQGDGKQGSDFKMRDLAHGEVHENDRGLPRHERGLVGFFQSMTKQEYKSRFIWEVFWGTLGVGKEKQR